MFMVILKPSIILPYLCNSPVLRGRSLKVKSKFAGSLTASDDSVSKPST